MKLKHIFALYIAMFLSIGCNQKPIGHTLLSTDTLGGVVDTTTTTTEDGSLDIQPDNSEMTVNIDDSDRVEITGTCKDLDRKKNRILVEVFAGEDETATPYIDNSLSDLCQSNALAEADLAATKCFWVTKGIGLIEDAGLPTEKSFPQCHNGRFGFAVKLGKSLETGTVGVFKKYTIRFKLRTTDGILSDSTYGRVTVDRNINMPNIDSVTADNLLFRCDLKMSPARFNHKIVYTLKRVASHASGDLTSELFTPAKTTSFDATAVDHQDTVFNWRDENYNLYHSNYGVIAGVTYTYTLTSLDTNYTYTVGAPTKTSNPVTCTIPRPTISITQTPTAGTCYVNFDSDVRDSARLEWAYSTTNPNWPGVDSNALDGFTTVTCDAGFLPDCKKSGLDNTKTYYFAVRDTDRVAGREQLGKWSNVFSCKPP